MVLEENKKIVKQNFTSDDEINLRKEMITKKLELLQEFQKNAEVVAEQIALIDAEKEIELDENILSFEKAIKDNKKQHKKIISKIEK